MPHYPVRQPNGKLAIYSTIVDSFTMYDCDTAEVVDEILNWHKDTKGRLYGMVSDIKFGQVPEEVCEHWHGWEYCLSWAAYSHGWDDEVVTEFMNMTSIDGRQRIRDTVAQYQAERED